VTRCRKTLFEQCEHSARKHGLPVPAKAAADLTLAAAKDYLQSLTNKIQAMREECDQQLRALRAAVDAQEKEVTTLRGQLQRYEVEIDAKKNEIDRLDRCTRSLSNPYLIPI
jgi:septal ring factor EnvC (AmiA/AmiB activator)